jgi:Calcineurin-like phosphoesterase
MKTLILSDLHLGSASQADVLRLPHARERLLAALSGVDRLVLLGDVLELRHGPPREALKAARPLFEALGEQMADGEIVLTAGNHDHALVETWLARRSEEDDGDALPFGLEQRLEPARASRMAQQLAEWASPAKLEVAFPGLWVRSDVYALHGHYLDCHITVPTMERVAVALMGKLAGRSLQSIGSVEGYEAMTAPIYALADAVAAQGATKSAFNGAVSVRAWRLLHRGPGGENVRGYGPLANGAKAAARRGAFAAGLGAGLRSGAMRRGFPLAISALNRAGLGPLKADISGLELRRAGLRAIGEVAARLGIGEAYVVFGHTHRAGPLPGDVESEWRGRLGARLINCGSWTYNAGFPTPSAGENPYWPGACVIVDDAEPLRPPHLLRLLVESEQTDLTPALA